ncbi:MAG: porin [Saprospiraceae bacterium]|nr:porin [Saprospiraceae bacterium]
MHLKNFTKFFLAAVMFWGLASSVNAQEKKEVDHSYKPLVVKLNDDGSKYVRFIIWHQQWLTSNNLSAENSKFQVNSLARRSRFLAFAQVSPRFLILTHFGLNNLSTGNMTSLGNNGDGPQFFLHDAWTEFKVADQLYIGGGLHYWKGLTRMSNGSTLNFMTLDAPRPFIGWHSLGITDQFARHLGVYAKGEIGKFDYRLAVNNPMRPSNSIGAGADFGKMGSTLTYTGAASVDQNGDPTGNTIVEGYFRYNFWDKESTKLPYQVGSYLGGKKVLGLGAGFFAHPNGMYNEESAEHENVTHFAVDAFLDMPVKGGDCLNAYAAFMAFNYGENYVSRWAGTGNAIYAQLGYKFKDSKFMPYVAFQNASYEGFEKSLNGLDVGLNYFILGHNAKLTLEYHQIMNDPREVPAFDYDTNNTFSQIRLQAHIFL